MKVVLPPKNTNETLGSASPTPHVLSLIQKRIAGKKQFDMRRDKSPSFGQCAACDPGAHRVVCGRGGMVVKKTGSCTHQGVVRPLVTFMTACLEKSDSGISRKALLLIHNAAHSPTSETLIPPDQMEWHGLQASCEAKLHGGKQTIECDEFEIPLWWTGED